MPPTMPPIARGERPEDEEGLRGGKEEEMVGVLDAEVAGVEVGFVDAPGVVDVWARSCWASMGYWVALGLAELREENVVLRAVEFRKRIVFCCLLQQTRNCFAFWVHCSLGHVLVVFLGVGIWQHTLHDSSNRRRDWCSLFVALKVYLRSSLRILSRRSSMARLCCLVRSNTTSWSRCHGYTCLVLCIRRSCRHIALGRSHCLRFR